MKRFWVLLLACVWSLSGCGDLNESGASRRRAYPPLDAAPPPPLVPYVATENTPPMLVKRSGTNTMRTEWTPDQELYQKRRILEEQVASLRAYAARAGADDPFALTEEEIRALEERGESDVL